MKITDPKRRAQLLQEGFCVVENVLTPIEMAELREATDGLLAAMSAEDARRERTTGSMIPAVKDHRLAKLIAHPRALGALEAMGLEDTRFQSGYIISKPPKSPRLFWHFDWGFWNHELSFQTVPVQLFLMYYLTDTTRENGCLRVIPRSHIVENPLHRLMLNAHVPALKEAQDLNRVEFQLRPDEVDVKVRAGDLVVGDSRILHAAHSNDSSHRRTVITLWYHPRFGSLPEQMRAAFVTRCDSLPPDWPDDARRLYESVAIRYSGNATPMPFSRGWVSRKQFEKHVARETE
jgi:ectoine hydroxylase-related dioxygenase (phytanoyl-CoA dioxygenase family)